MKSLIEEKLEEITRKLDEVLEAVSILQDNLIQLNAVLEAINVKAMEKELISGIAENIERGLKRFKDESPKECDFRSFCTARVEKAAMRVLQTLASKGTEEGLKELRRHLEAVEKYRNGCKDEKCLKNAVDTFKFLEKLIEEAKQNASNKKELLKLSPELDEKKVAEEISAVSNAVRIKILKALAKGKKSYAELEKLTGLRGGHLRFHLRVLLNSNFIIRSEKKYAITNHGLRILKILSELQG